jgi:hypothetical protein
MGQVTVSKVVEGPSHIVIRVDLASDGTGELSDYVVLSPTDLIPRVKNNVPAFRLMQVWSSMIWFDVVLKVGVVTPSVLWTLARDTDNHVDFRSFGGLVDPIVYTNPLAADDGKLTISTNDFLQVGSRGVLVLELRKTNQASS